MLLLHKSVTAASTNWLQPLGLDHNHDRFKKRLRLIIRRLIILILELSLTSLSLCHVLSSILALDENYLDLDFRCSINFRPSKIWKLDIYRSRSRINQAESIGILDRSYHPYDFCLRFIATAIVYDLYACSARGRCGSTVNAKIDC